MLPKPSAIPVIPLKRKAEIRHRPSARWFKYAVHRTVGVFNPENSCSLHRSLKGARRAANRWVRSSSDQFVVERVD